MRITFLLGRFPRRPSGGALIVYEYANRLAARGHEVTVAHSLRLPNWKRPDKPAWHRRVRGEVRTWLEAITKPAPSWVEIDPRVRILHLADYTDRTLPDADVVVATFWPTVELAMALSPSKGKPFYLIQHHEAWAGDAALVDATWKEPLHKIVVADWLKRVGLKMGIPEAEITHIPNSLDHELFQLRAPLADRPRRVAMLYSETPWKGAPEGLAALAAAKAKFPEIEATLYGVWSRPDDLPDWIEYLKSPNRETIAREILPRCSIFLCPSWTEGWGLPGAEALACGCALVSTANDGVDDYGVHDRTALLSPPRDADALAANLIALLADEPRRLQLATAGEQAIRAFDWGNAVDRLEALFSTSPSGTWPIPPRSLRRAQ